MTEKKTFRASALPRIMQCHGSSIDPKVRIETTSDMAELGSAVHEGLADCVKHGLTKPRIEPLLSKYDIDDPGELRMLIWSGMRIWIRIEDHLSRVLDVEQKILGEIAGVDIGGTADILFETDTNELAVLDWKSGYIERDHRDQLFAYLWLAHKSYPEYTSFKAITAWVRSGEFEVYVVTLDDLHEWVKRVENAMQDDTCSPGGQCEFCPRIFECEPRNIMVRGISMDLVEVREGKAISDIDLAQAYPKVKILKRAIDEYDKLLKQAVKAAGSLAINNNESLMMGERKTRRIKILEALPVLGEHFGIKDYSSEGVELDILEIIAPSITIGKKRLMDIIGERAAYRMKGKDQKAVMENLEALGAVWESKSQVLTVVKGDIDG